MRLALGLILIVLGLVGAYQVLTGRFPPTQVQAQQGGSANFNNTGSGGVSISSKLTHLGVSVPSVHLQDRGASKGGFTHA